MDIGDSPRSTVNPIEIGVVISLILMGDAYPTIIDGVAISRIAARRIQIPVKIYPVPVSSMSVMMSWIMLL